MPPMVTATGRFGERLARIEGACRAEANRQLAAERHGIGGEQRGSVALHQHGEKQTDGSLAQYYHYIFGFRIELDHTFETGIKWLDETGAVERNTVRDLFDAAADDPIHDANVLRESAACGLVSGRHADLFVDRALRVQFVKE